MTVTAGTVKLDVYVRVNGREITVGTVEIPVTARAGYRPGPDVTDDGATVNLSARLRRATSAR